MVFFCKEIKISITTEEIEFYLLEKVYICPEMVLRYYIYRIKPWDGFRLFFCPHLTSFKTESLVDAMSTTALVNYIAIESNS